MLLLLRLGLRLIIIALAYLTACSVTAFALIVAAIIGDPRTSIPWGKLFSAEQAWGGVVAYTLFALGVVLPFSLIPFVIAVIYAESERVRSFPIFALFGAGVSFAAYWFVLMYFKQGIGFVLFDPSAIPFRFAEPLYFACFGGLGGAVYWLLAGRRSGSACT